MDTLLAYLVQTGALIALIITFFNQSARSRKAVRVVLKINKTRKNAMKRRD